MKKIIIPKLEFGFNQVLSKTFLWMFLGLISTAVVAFVTYNSDIFVNVIAAWPILAIIEVVLVLVFSATLRRCSPTVVTAIFFIYSMINGLTLSSIFYVYDLGSIGYAFLATAVLFGTLAFIGYKTQRDISKLGNILFVGLIVGLILSLVNIFIGSSMMEIGLDWLILAVFCGYTAYDMKVLKDLSNSGEIAEDRIAIYGALQLYLDFINIFIRILSLFGNSRD